MKQEIIIVNEQDEIIGYKERGTIEPSDIYRVSALWITNSHGEILLAQRAFSKKNNPGKWGPAVAGTNDKGETYEANIKKEIQEELGVSDVVIQKKFTERRRGEHNYFCTWFVAVVDKDILEFTIQKEEVEQIQWISPSDLKDDVQRYPEKYLRSIADCIDKFKL